MGLKMSSWQVARVQQRIGALVEYHVRSIVEDIALYSTRVPIRKCESGLVQEFHHGIEVDEELTKIIQRTIDADDPLLLKIIPDQYESFEEHLSYWTQQVSNRLPEPWKASRNHVYREWNSSDKLLEFDDQLIRLVDKAALLHLLRQADNPRLWAHFQDVEFPNTYPDADSASSPQEVLNIKRGLMRDIARNIDQAGHFNVYLLQHMMSVLDRVTGKETALSGGKMDVYQMGFLAGISRCINELSAVIDANQTDECKIAKQLP